MADQQIGTTTIRQRLLLWLETFSADASSLPALGELSTQLLTNLRARWQTPDVPLYPAFSPEPR